MSRGRRIVGTVAYLLFLLVLVELALQTFYYVKAGDFLFARTGLPIYAANEWSGVFNRPNLSYEHHTNEFASTNYTNEQGLRVPEGQEAYPHQPSPGTKRILLLGPSFAYGWGVDYEETFGHLLERALERGGWGDGSRVELINAGVPSLGAGPHLSWFRQVGARFQPDLVIQFAYATMAVKNIPRSRARVTEEGYLVGGSPSLGRRLRSYAKKSAIVFYSWIAYTRLDQALSDSGEAQGDGEVLGAGRELQMQRAFSLESPVVVESLDYYRALRETVREEGAELLVVHFPLSYAVHEEDESRWRHLGVQDVAAQRAFDRAFCEHLNGVEQLPCLDITEPLQRTAAEGDERLYFWLDIHWTEAGNRRAAEAVADHLLQGHGSSG